MWLIACSKAFRPAGCQHDTGDSALAHASTPARSGPRFGRELAVRPIEPGVAAILTRDRLRVLMPRLPLAPVLASGGSLRCAPSSPVSLRSSLAIVFGCS